MEQNAGDDRYCQLPVALTNERQPIAYTSPPARQAKKNRTHRHMHGTEIFMKFIVE